MKITDKAKLAELLRKVEEVRITIDHTQEKRGFTLRVSPQSVLTLIERTKVKSVDARLSPEGEIEGDHSLIVINTINGGRKC